MKITDIFKGLFLINMEIVSLRFASMSLHFPWTAKHFLLCTVQQGLSHSSNFRISGNVSILSTEPLWYVGFYPTRGMSTHGKALMGRYILPFYRNCITFCTTEGGLNPYRWTALTWPEVQDVLWSSTHGTFLPVGLPGHPGSTKIPMMKDMWKWYQSIFWRKCQSSRKHRWFVGSL